MQGISHHPEARVFVMLCWPSLWRLFL